MGHAVRRGEGLTPGQAVSKVHVLTGEPENLYLTDVSRQLGEGRVGNGANADIPGAESTQCAG